MFLTVFGLIWETESKFGMWKLLNHDCIIWIYNIILSINRHIMCNNIFWQMESFKICFDFNCTMLCIYT